MRLALGQINPTIGDFDGNIAQILDVARRAKEGRADLAVLPELALNGYPPRDLVETPAFIERTDRKLGQLAEACGEIGIDAVVGFVGRAFDQQGHRAANCAALLSGGEIAFVQQKMLLPTYDVFDEGRYFAAAEEQGVCEIGGLRVGITICEDAWNDKQFWPQPRYRRDPVSELAESGIDFILNISSSPYHMGKRELRERMIGAAARRVRKPIIMVNQVGGNDQLVFDGSSFVVNGRGEVVARAKSFAPDLIFFDTENPGFDLGPREEDEVESLYDALVLGVRDYIGKCGFSQAVVGLSGGIDSAITATIAVDALGAENVMAAAMPGPYSSEHSLRDARDMASRLGIRLETISIVESYETTLRALASVFAGLAPDVTEENIQARLRGLTLMAISNKLGAMVLTTGNKSELAVGYCTLYGDMAGGLAVISDVPKTMVYPLSRVANQRRPGTIPESVFTKAPSAELRPDQKDSDSLPPYEILDPILRLYIEEHLSILEIAEQLGQPEELVKRICGMVDRNEYKRQQAAPGLRVTSKAFGVGRRFPIAQRFVR
jgi:NAD+ synthase/NAD+ synthase (glutamine-hydrolysing)